MIRQSAIPNTRFSRRPRFTARTVCGLASAALAVPALLILLHLAEGRLAMACLILISTAVVYAKPVTAFFIVPTLWPVLDRVPWTGQMHFTESDALLLSACAAVFLHHAIKAPPRQPGATLKPSPIAWLVLALIGLSYAVSSLPLLWPLPPIDANFWFGYDTPANTLRLAKALPLAAVFCIALQMEAAARGSKVTGALAWGLVGGLLSVSLAALWERLAYPGFSNFSADYRTTALFWEMHVGGAALDGWLMLTIPVLVALLHEERRPLQAGVLMAISALAAYALLTTFSRAAYLGAGVGILITFLLCALRRRPARQADAAPHSKKLWWLVVALCLVSAVWAFAGGGGYRGLLAQLGLIIAIWFCAPIMARVSPLPAGLAVVAGAAGGVLGIAVADLLPKGPYLIYGVLWVIVLALRLSPRRVLPLLGGLVALAVMAAWVGFSWSEGKSGYTPVVASLAALAMLAVYRLSPRPPWHADLGGAINLGATLMLAVGIAVGAGSYYVGERFSTLDQDLEHRFEHWSSGAALVGNERERWLGIGVGRFPGAYFWNVPKGQYPGTLSIIDQDDERFLRIGGARHMQGFGELLRLSQRVPSDIQGPVLIRFSARAEGAVSVGFEICSKWLLYEDGCTLASTQVGGGSEWRTYEAVLPAKKLWQGPFYAPALAVFSMSSAGRGSLDVRDVSVFDTVKGELVANGRFEDGAAHWFFTSDRHHLPWHAKNLYLHMWVEQGWLGLAALALGFGLALIRAVVRPSRNPLLLCGIAGALSGLMIVGIADSLLDMARLSVMLFVMFYLSLALKRTPMQARALQTTGQAASLPSANAHSEPKVSNT